MGYGLYVISPVIMRLLSTSEDHEDEGYEIEYNPYLKRLTFCGHAAEQLIAFDVDLVEGGGWHHVAFTFQKVGGNNKGQFYLDGDVVENESGTF